MKKIRLFKWQGWLGPMIILTFVLWLLIIFALIGAIHYTGIVDNPESADVIIVLGAGLSRSGRPGWALTRRATHAAELWHQGFAPYIICTGGVGNGQTRSEADACREVLMRNAVPSSLIILEDRSRSTEENAIFSQELMDAQGWDTALIVSDSYHIFRAGYLFSGQDIEVFSSPVAYERINNPPFYIYSLLREVAALHWQVFKDIFDLQITHIPRA
jgi:uncharacterized SAM-binding protein YcdF (DUF218 family)